MRPRRARRPESTWHGNEKVAVNVGQANACLALDEISDIATHRAHFEGSSQGTLTWAVTRDGFAKLRIIVEHAIANQRTTR